MMPTLARTDDRTQPSGHYEFLSDLCRKTQPFEARIPCRTGFADVFVTPDFGKMVCTAVCRDKFHSLDRYDDCGYPVIKFSVDREGNRETIFNGIIQGHTQGGNFVGAHSRFRVPDYAPGDILVELIARHLTVEERFGRVLDDAVVGSSVLAVHYFGEHEGRGKELFVYMGHDNDRVDGMTVRNLVRGRLPPRYLEVVATLHSADIRALRIIPPIDLVRKLSEMGR